MFDELSQNDVPNQNFASKQVVRISSNLFG